MLPTRVALDESELRTSLSRPGLKLKAHAHMAQARNFWQFSLLSSDLFAAVIFADIRRKSRKSQGETVSCTLCQAAFALKHCSTHTT